jgi:hypothetical protein
MSRSEDARPEESYEHPFALYKDNLSRHDLRMMPQDPRFSSNDKRVVEVLAYPSVKLLDVSGPIQVFATANSLMKQKHKAEPYVTASSPKADNR